VARIPEAEIERLKAEVSLAEAAGVVLRRNGSDLTGCCPFHEDGSPLLVISPQKTGDFAGSAAIRLSHSSVNGAAKIIDSMGLTVG
jgi:hypothetical protein